MMIANQRQIIYQNICAILKIARKSIIDDNETLEKQKQDLTDMTISLKELSNELKSWNTLIDNLHTECESKLEDIADDIEFKKGGENIVSTTNSTSNFKFVALSSGRMRWADLSDEFDIRERVIENVNNTINELSNQISNVKELNNINGVSVGTLKLPIINKIEDIPPAIYWFNGDKKYKEGMYISLDKDCYIEIPFPNTIDGTKNSIRTSSIKCKYGTIDNCLNVRELYAQRYRSEVRKCNFAHKGDNYVKIGTIFRCPNIPGFGNYEAFSDDLKNITMDDIRILWMYSISDILLTKIWWQNNTSDKNIKVINDLDICV